MLDPMLVQVRSEGAAREEATAASAGWGSLAAALRGPVRDGLPGVGGSFIANQKAQGRFAAFVRNIVFLNRRL